jgi:hypothetical protein
MLISSRIVIIGYMMVEYSENKIVLVRMIITPIMLIMIHIMGLHQPFVGLWCLFLFWSTTEKSSVPEGHNMMEGICAAASLSLVLPAMGFTMYYTCAITFFCLEKISSFF